MTFKNYLQTRKPNDSITWDFIYDARDDSRMPNINSWTELRNYLKDIKACDGAFEAANLVWRCYRMQKKKGRKFLKKECFNIRKESEDHQMGLDDFNPPKTTFFVKSRNACQSRLAELVMGLVIQDQQANSFTGPNGFPAVEVGCCRDAWRITIYTKFGEAPPIILSNVAANRLLRENYKKAITSENFPELHKTVVNRICYLEYGPHNNAEFEIGAV